MRCRTSELHDVCELWHWDLLRDECPSVCSSNITTMFVIHLFLACVSFEIVNASLLLSSELSLLTKFPLILTNHGV